LACAGAWIAPEHGQQITTYTHGQGAQGVELFAEAPIGGRASVLGVIQEDRAVSAEVAAKAVVWREGGAIAAAQAGVFWREEPGFGCNAWGGEVRGLAGFGQGAWFVNV
jgi:hypothetical protein